MKNRLINDYIMKDRYKEYYKLLKDFKDNGYEFICIKDYKKLENTNKKAIIIRHDIDSDVKIAKKLFEIERKLEIQSTYYFRLSTIDKRFMQEIVSQNSEVGYHYEEIAQYCKENKNIDATFVKNNIEKIKENFTKNINDIEKNCNIKLSSIASHGDFVNRKIQMTNNYLYDENIKQKLNLIEAYDIENLLDYRTADTMYPKFWKQDPYIPILEDKKRVLILIHPRWWNKAPIERFKLDMQRVIEQIRYGR